MRRDIRQNKFNIRAQQIIFILGGIFFASIIGVTVLKLWKIKSIAKSDIEFFREILAFQQKLNYQRFHNVAHDAVLSNQGILCVSPDPYIKWVLRANSFVEYDHWCEGIDNLEGKKSEEGCPPVIININSLGFRSNEDFSIAKPADTYRVICMGGSTTFGYPHSQNQGYPEFLQQLINIAPDGKKIQVINAGVPGYTVFQAYWYLRHYLIFFAPDIIVYDGGFNDGSPYEGYDDAPPLTRWDLLKSNFSKNIVQNIQKKTPDKRQNLSLSDKIEQDIELYGPKKYRLSIPVQRHKKLLVDFISYCLNRQVKLILLNTEYCRSIYRNVWIQTAHKFGVPSLDMRDIFFEGDIEDSNKLEQEHRLDSKLLITVPPPGEITLVFRAIFPPNYQQGEKYYLTYVIINDFWKQFHQVNWDNLKYRLSDDGDNGDQRGGDRIWSIALTLPEDRLIKYFFIIGGDSEKWTQDELGINPLYWGFSRFVYTDKAYLDKFMIKSKMPNVYLTPISRYGSLNYLSEPVHQNIDGNRLIAQKLVAMILSALGDKCSR